ncbi:integrin alpha-PS2 isoform X2 [Folsomia candida]|uniref:integrin alpha-PS2 isoform X2 n=1 Tax=Folsomia candida TaxID=158441 RepID=UPI000B8FB8D5|nr:integrin alpha-PS2 isoform X2 [Folsomia candida]
MPKMDQFVKQASALFPSLVVLVSFYTLTSFRITQGFNIDIPSVITHNGPGGSMFGFSVAQHHDSNTSWILVGAPTADSNLQATLRKPGAVYRCSCVHKNSCQQLPFDRQGNNMVEGKQIDEKSFQWFGATVRSSGDDGIILACAPRYIWFSTNRKRRDPVGTCFVAKDSFTEFTEYSPCRTSRWGYHRQGSCQLGLGGDIDSDGRRIFLGAVGSWYWQGQMFMIDSRKTESTGDNRVPFYQFLQPGQVYSQSSWSRDIRWTKEGPSWDDDSYLGYSVAHGEFSGDNESDVAVGMPRGANLTGKVVIYSSDLTNLHNITGEQIGAYFGYSLCVLDMDGDGLDDIVVGSPMYTDFNDPGMKIETGRIYVIYQTKRHKFRKWDSVDGTAHKGRFGLSLTSLGDINKDGFNDFAVGAPYDGVTGRGAVYIFQGSSTGVRKEFTQVIYGESVSQGISTFGFSLSGGKDLDGNQYPDLLVGSYDSDSVSYFRSKPVVRVKSKLSFSSALNKQVNLEEKGCTLRDLTPVTCLPLSLCMEYDGEGADDVIDFNVQYNLDSKKSKDPRMFFLNQEGRNILNETVRLTKRKQHCTSQQVYLRPHIRDKLTSLEAELKCSMRESRYQQRDLQPVIDVTTSSAEKDSISIQKNCGQDNICVPDLRLKVSQPSKSFLMGSSERIHVDVEVHNNGEDSYESMMYMTVPPGLSYVNFEKKTDSRKDVPILCSAPSPSTNNTIKCDIGNPMPTFATAKFRVIFQPRYGSEVKSSYDFHVTVNSTNPEETYAKGDNAKSFSLPIRVSTDLKVYGVSKEEIIQHNASQWKQSGEFKSESEIGPEVYHIYDIKCQGPSHIANAEVTIIWPSYLAGITHDGDSRHFMYLLEQPRVDGPGECDFVEDVNPLGLTILHRRWENIIVHGDNRATTTVVDSEEGLIGGEGRRGGSTSSSSTFVISSGGGGYGDAGSNSSTHREHSEHRSSSSGGYTQRTNYSSRSYSSSSQSEESPQYPYNRHRNERAASDDDSLEKELRCGPTECIKIRCRIHELASGSSILFMLRSRVFSRTIVEEFGGEHVNVSSKIIARVTQLPYNVDPSYLKFKKYEIVTTIEEVPDLSVPSAIPWWVYFLAALAGLILLLLIIYILYKCGFFRRRRPGRGGPDSQPLRGNRGR